MSAQFRDIEELLLQVCGSLEPERALDRNALFALAMSSRQLSRLALDALWRDLRWIEPLLALLGCTSEMGYILVSPTFQ